MRMGIRSLAVAVAVALSMSLGALSAGAAPVPFETVDVTLHQEQSGAVLMISGKLPKGTKLPAQVQLAAPKGAELHWAGEILGGNPSEDPSVEPKMTTKGDQDLYTFTLTKSLTGQIEVDGSGLVGFDGSQYATTIGWTAPMDIPTLTMSVRLPVSANVGQLPEGVESVPGPSGYTYYQLTSNKVKAGTAKELGFTYTIPAGAAGAAGGSPAGASSSAADVFVPLALVVAFVGVVYVLARKKYAGTKVHADEGVTANGAAASEDGTPFSVDAADEDVVVAEGEATPAARKKLGPAVIVSAGIIVVLVISMSLASRKSASVTSIPGGYMQEFAQGDACSSVVVDVNLEGENAEKAAARLFEAVKPTTALRATLYTEGAPRLEVGFCESQTTPDKIKAALAPTGLVAE